MGKIVRRDVFVHGAAHGGENRWFHPGDTLPNWAEDLVTNPKVFEWDGIAVDDDPEPEPEVQWGATDYHAFTVAQLKDILEERELHTTGNKSVLIERLEENDAALG